MTIEAATGASAPTQTPFEDKKYALAKFGIDPSEVVHEQGRYWMTAEQLGLALGYKKPGQSVRNLYNRHKDELRPYKGYIKTMSPPAKDGRGGGLQEILAFNTDGMWLIAIFAKTPKSKKFRKFIISMLKALERDEFIHISQVEKWRKDLLELRIGQAIEKSTKITWKIYREMIRFREMGLTQKETAKLLDISKDMVQRFERILRKYNLRLVKGGAA